MSEAERIALGLTKPQRRLIADMANGGSFHAALREPGDFMDDGVVFSELVGIIVHPTGGDRAKRYRIRNKTAGPLYLHSPALVDCIHGDSGFREFNLTPLGLEVRNVLLASLKGEG